MTNRELTLVAFLAELVLCCPGKETKFLIKQRMPRKGSKEYLQALEILWSLLEKKQDTDKTAKRLNNSRIPARAAVGEALLWAIAIRGRK